MRAPDVDVAVVGGGPAGVAAACEARRLGLTAALIDPGRPPAPRVETLPENGRAIAAGLGLDGAFAAAGLGRAAGVEMRWREAPERRDFGGRGPTLLDRARLHAALRVAAAARGVRLVGARLRGVGERGGGVDLATSAGALRARFVIDARGRAGGGDLVAVPFRGRREGARLDAPLLTLQALPEGWVWASAAPDGAASGAWFLRPAALAGLGAPARLARLRAALAETGLCDLTLAGPPQPAGAAALSDPFPSPLRLCVGDRALARDPIASHGLFHALRSGAQAAAAAATLLDPNGDAAAARAFVRDRHAEAVRASATGEARAHAEQRLHRSAFWTARPAPAEPEPEPLAPPPAPSAPLALAAPLRRAAALRGARICWTEALEIDGRPAARVGPLSARRLARLLDPPAPRAELEARMAGEVPPETARALIARLIAGGALRAAGARDATAAG